ncbi:hypothetical protein K505DRAFT_377943 [Melanomma pulvis-pyrius CBS 109.77]|uniref:Rhodopsin domain-containing protein n=1 Tax=Melanomma pulvis-pyrius CBS 109.77 TaxID=1314802 RepID=A0A6A6X0F9_9PLEO|nr:hypothetical protein K505DRAFT_377943 [Melanomma pulvis-pyrius CBS 109.77]
MATVTIQDILSWPKPNHVNPTSRVPLLLGFEIPLSIIMTSFVGVRMYVRYSKKTVGWDDWTMMIAWVIAMSIFLCNCISVHWGIGLHVWDVYIPNAIPLAKLALCFQLLFPPCIGFTKISICLTYLRVFPFKTNKWFCYCTMTYVVGWSIAVFFAIMFQCWPVEANWDFFNMEKFCIDRRIFLISTAALNSLTDLLVFLWPAKYIWNIQLPVSQRKGLMASFTLGCLVCVAGACRIWYIIVYYNSYDTSWEGAPTYVIAAFETNLGIICGCIPPTRLFFAKLFPRILGSTLNSKNSKPSTSSTSKTSGVRSLVQKFRLPKAVGDEEDGITLRSLGTEHGTKGEINRSISRNTETGSNNDYRESGSRDEERGEIRVQEPKVAYLAEPQWRGNQRM